MGSLNWVTTCTSLLHLVPNMAPWAHMQDTAWLDVYLSEIPHVIYQVRRSACRCLERLSHYLICGNLPACVPACIRVRLPGAAMEHVEKYAALIAKKRMLRRAPHT